MKCGVEVALSTHDISKHLLCTWVRVLYGNDTSGVHVRGAARKLYGKACSVHGETRSMRNHQKYRSELYRFRRLRFIFRGERMLPGLLRDPPFVTRAAQMLYLYMHNLDIFPFRTNICSLYFVIFVIREQGNAAVQDTLSRIQDFFITPWASAISTPFISCFVLFSPKAVLCCLLHIKQFLPGCENHQTQSGEVLERVLSSDIWHKV